MEKNPASTSGCLKMPSRSQVLRMAKPWPVWEATSESGRNVHLPRGTQTPCIWARGLPITLWNRRREGHGNLPWLRQRWGATGPGATEIPSNFKGTFTKSAWTVTSTLAVMDARSCDLPMAQRRNANVYMSNVFGVINRMIILDKVYSCIFTIWNLRPFGTVPPNPKHHF